MTGKIYISGLIGTIGDEIGVELVDVISQVKKQPNATSFEVHINSEGGIVETGFDIYNYLKSLGLPITTIGNGLVASIATVIFMVGSKRQVTPGTQFMIHYPMAGILDATADEMERYSKELKSVQNQIVDFYAKHTNIQKDGIMPLLRNETFFTEKQLFDLGFITQETTLKVAARAIINNQKNKKMTKKKSDRFARIMKIITGKEAIVNKVVFTADNTELVFPELDEDAEIKVGDTATIDGSPAEGSIVIADGRTLVFEEGAVTEIIEATEEEATSISEEEVAEVLTEILEIVEEVAEEVEEVKEEVTAVKRDRDAYKARLEKAERMIAKMKGITGKQPETDPRQKHTKEESVSSIVANWKTNKTKKK